MPSTSLHLVISRRSVATTTVAMILMVLTLPLSPTAPTLALLMRNAFTFRFKNGACYSKFSLSELSSVGSVCPVKLFGTRPSAGSNAVIFPSATASASDSASAIASATSTLIPEFNEAIANNGTGNCNVKYHNVEIESAFTLGCGIDDWGADIGTPSGLSTFGEYMGYCDGDTECIIVTCD
ncbi:hypothetical protein P153DRAFT_358677 [Dothidotthia symphoricarpi CBS 119687]|uniref:Uncharacterized protein n=1 Tax=Dothidotthia symphoricarpi CBS 119687 TaxID=1392245 RepID=A0A6A6A7N4_9PLEO|nr:uncharacterized protein P153DRAFT_358677 [Dothidotthia symphoricarpi CBS 119687]KAF2127850.1 hypothetical protein P153DRAFT_358677 [Dothidotthia symphoricarpi CBS 119687]